MFDKEYLKQVLTKGIEVDSSKVVGSMRTFPTEYLDLPEPVELVLMILLRASYGYDCVSRESLDEQIKAAMVAKENGHCHCCYCDRPWGN